LAALIILLVVSYLYGLKRLAALQGPSIDEFKSKTPPPWQGQRRGFKNLETRLFS
jgi:hypothetical protein